MNDERSSGGIRHTMNFYRRVPELGEAERAKPGRHHPPIRGGLTNSQI